MEGGVMVHQLGALTVLREFDSQNQTMWLTNICNSSSSSALCGTYTYIHKHTHYTYFYLKGYNMAE